MEIDVWGANHSFMQFGYRLGQAWYESWDPQKHWAWLLCSSAVCLYLAELKSRSRMLWGVLGFSIPVVSAVALLFFPSKAASSVSKVKKATRQQREAAYSVIAKVKNTRGVFQVPMHYFATTQRAELHEYTIASLQQHSARNQSLKRLNAYGLPEDVRPATNIGNWQALKCAMAEAAFTVKEQDKALAEDITELFIHQLINEREYIKAIASLAFNDGKNTVNIAENDVYGAPVFPNETKRQAAKLAVQFFFNHCATKYEVGALYALHCYKLP